MATTEELREKERMRRFKSIQTGGITAAAPMGIQVKFPTSTVRVDAPQRPEASTPIRPDDPRRLTTRPQQQSTPGGVTAGQPTSGPASPAPAANAGPQQPYWAQAGYPSELAYKQRVHDVKTKRQLQLAALSRTPVGTPGREDIVMGLRGEGGTNSELQALQRANAPVNRQLTEQEIAANRARLNQQAEAIVERDAAAVPGVDAAETFRAAGQQASGRRPSGDPATEAFLRQMDVTAASTPTFDGSDPNATTVGGDAVRSAQEQARIDQVRTRQRLEEFRRRGGIQFEGTPQEVAAGQGEAIARQTRDRSDAAAIAGESEARRATERRRIEELRGARHDADVAGIREEERMAREGPRQTPEDRVAATQAEIAEATANLQMIDLRDQLTKAGANNDNLNATTDRIFKAFGRFAGSIPQQDDADVIDTLESDVSAFLSEWQNMPIADRNFYRQALKTELSTIPGGGRAGLGSLDWLLDAIPFMSVARGPGGKQLTDRVNALVQQFREAVLSQD